MGKQMFRRLLLIFQLFLPLFYINAANPIPPDNFRKITNNAFAEGEKLTFDVKYGFVTAGIGTMEIPKLKKISGRDAYYVLFTVNTVPSFDWVFKVRDRYETYVDKDALFPWRFEQHIREGKFSRDFSAFFDQRKGKAKTSGGEYVIPKNVNDILSAFYLVRTMDFSKLKKNDRINMHNFYQDTTYDLDVMYHGRETVEVPAGKFDCIVVEPLVKEGGLFKSEGSIMIYLTNDEAKMPVRVKTKVIIGSINADLTAYVGVKGKLTSKR
jgi:hypothetical protein